MVDGRPLTRASKSFSDVGSKVVPVTPPKAMKSSLGVVVVPPSSCSLRVCSSSTRRERLLINSMKDWNCLRFRRGPRLILQRIGKRSMATKSASATPPTIRSTSKAATMTAGSFVLIALIRGTIFSCIVYLSRALDDEVLLTPLRPSSSPFVPPQRMTKARRPRTLMARLFVLLKTVAITGKSSFLMVLKSRTGKTTGRLRRAASTIE